jgi:hypothetical protein
MCDKESFKALEKRVDGLEKAYAVHAAQSCEQIKTLFNAVQKLFWITCVFGGILLLTVVYGAIGEHGFNHVIDASKEVVR